MTPTRTAAFLFAAAVVAPAVVVPLPAQGATTFVPKPAMLRIAAEDVPALLAQLSTTAAGKLLANAEVAEAFAAGLKRYRAQAARSTALLQAVQQREVPLDEWTRASLPVVRAWSALHELDLADLQRIEARSLRPEPDEMPLSLALLSCRPRAEGRWTAICERHAKLLGSTPGMRSAPDTKLEGLPVWQWEPAPDDDAEDPDDATAVILGMGRMDLRAWLLHVPGAFAFGNGTPEQCGTLGPAPERGPARIDAEIDVAAFLGLFANPAIGGPPQELRALGVDAVRALRWRAAFVGERILDEIEVELADTPSGLVAMLLMGTAALPRQPLPAGALAQLRCALDLALLPSVIDASGLGEIVPDQLVQLVGKAFTGGVALGAAAPPKGGLIPRLVLSLGIADQKALDELLGAMLGGDASRATKQVEYEGVPCTVAALPGAPAAFQPSWCTLDGVLHVAESAASLRAFLQARAGGGDAMDVGDAPVPPGPGDALPTFDLRLDEQSLYRTFHAVWLPLLRLVPSHGETPLVEVDEMPSPDAVLPHLGRTRGVLRRDGATFRLQQLGALGGIELAAAAMVWGPLLSGPFHRDSLVDQLEHGIAQHQLAAVWTELEAFHKANGRWPNDLGELFVARKLADDALLLPGDPAAVPVALPAGDPRTVRSSYRFFPKPVTVELGGNTHEVLLVGIAPRPFYRPMLTADGNVPEVFGELSTQPIDRFGK